MPHRPHSQGHVLNLWHRCQRLWRRCVHSLSSFAGAGTLVIRATSVPDAPGRQWRGDGAGGLRAR